MSHTPDCLCPACVARRTALVGAARRREPIVDKSGAVLWRCRCSAEGAHAARRWWHAVWPDGRAVAEACVACADARLAELEEVLARFWSS